MRAQKPKDPLGVSVKETAVIAVVIALLALITAIAAFARTI